MLIEALDAAVERTAADLSTTPPEVFSERAFGERLEGHLTTAAGPSWSVRRELGVAAEHWPGVGPVDLALESPPDLPLLVELKWGGENLFNAAWDAAKLALLCATGVGETGFLVAAAEADHWEVNPGRELFDARSWRADVFLERYDMDFARWHRELKTHPRRLPSFWRATQGASVPFELEGEPWELRTVGIEVDDADLARVLYVPRAPGSTYWAQRDIPPGKASPEVFSVVAGSGLGPGFEVRWDRGRLNIHRRSYRGELTTVTAEPSEDQWRGFWRKLDLIDVWSWDARYETEDIVTDGYGWEIDLAFRGRRCRSEGYMAFPGGDEAGPATWSALLLALGDLVALDLLE